MFKCPVFSGQYPVTEEDTACLEFIELRNIRERFYENQLHTYRCAKLPRPRPPVPGPSSYC